MTQVEPITTPWDDDPLMYPAFIGCVHWALGDESVVSAFRTKTGVQWKPGRTGIEQAIDRATGADRDFFQRFSDFVADEIFGRPDP